MNAHGSMTTMPVPTGARVRRAWETVSEELRRSTAAAVATAVLLASAVPLAPVMQAALAVSGGVLALAALVDVCEHRLPNRLIGAAAVAPLVGAVVGLEFRVLLQSFGGALVAGGAMLVVRLARGVGMGDVKMAAAVGAGVGMLSIDRAAVAIAVAALVAAGWGAARRRNSLPLGPSLWFGWATTIALAAFGW